MAGATVAGIGAGLGLLQTIQGNKMRKNAQNELNNYERIDLQNAFENMPISTVGSELMREESQRATATAVDAARNGGMRGIFGTLPGIVAAQNDLNRDAQKYLDDQVTQRNYAIADDNVRIQRMKEQRDYANIGALSEQVQAGRQDTWSGLRAIGASAMYGANNIVRPQRDTVQSVSGNLSPMGLMPIDLNASQPQPNNPGAPYPQPANDPYYNPWNFNMGF